jgi:hypothetical protein
MFPDIGKRNPALPDIGKNKKTPARMCGRQTVDKVQLLENYSF